MLNVSLTDLWLAQVVMHVQGKGSFFHTHQRFYFSNRCGKTMHLGVSPFEVIKTRVTAIKEFKAGADASSGGSFELDFEHAASANTKSTSALTGSNAVQKVFNISAPNVSVSLTRMASLRSIKMS
jgi:hypothetical protein